MANTEASAIGEGALIEHLERRRCEAIFSAGMALLHIREIDLLISDLRESMVYWREQEIDALLRVTMAGSVSIGARDEDVNYFLDVAAENLIRVGKIRERLSTILVYLEDAEAQKQLLLFERSEARMHINNLGNRIYNIRHPFSG